MSGVTGAGSRDGTGRVDALRRWQEAGGVWRVVHREPSRATVALLTCAGGEEVERISGDEPAWLDFLADREGSEDAE